jgi:hypothetical protein
MITRVKCTVCSFEILIPGEPGSNPDAELSRHLGVLNSIADRIDALVASQDQPSIEKVLDAIRDLQIRSHLNHLYAYLAFKASELTKDGSGTNYTPLSIIATIRAQLITIDSCALWRARGKVRYRDDHVWNISPYSLIVFASSEDEAIAKAMAAIVAISQRYDDPGKSELTSLELID